MDFRSDENEHFFRLYLMHAYQVNNLNMVTCVGAWLDVVNILIECAGRNVTNHDFF